MSFMKKIVTIVISLALILSSVLAVSARHYNSLSNNVSKNAYSVCTIEDCVKTGFHTHNNQYYTAHYYGDGHDYHEYCGYEDCTIFGYHEHDGVYCFAHTINDGHDYHDYCGYSYCTLTGYHEHGGEYCFGYGRGYNNTTGSFGRGSCCR